MDENQWVKVLTLANFRKAKELTGNVPDVELCTAALKGNELFDTVFISTKIDTDRNLHVCCLFHLPL